MNQLNCTSGLATDETFAFGLTPPCSTSLVTFDVMTSVLLILRFITMMSNWIKWLSIRNHHLKSTSNNMTARALVQVWERRVPFMAILGTMIFTGWILMFVLVRYNVMNVSNGGPFFLWCLLYSIHTIYNSHYQRRNLELGRKVIPMMRKNLTFPADPSGASEDEQSKRWRFLEEFDSILRLIFGLQVFSSIIQLICGCVGLGVQNRAAIMIVAFSFEGIYMLLAVAFLTYQLHRIKLVCLESGLNEDTKVAVQKKVSSQQFYFGCAGAISALCVILIAAGVIPLVWEILIFSSLSETLASSFVVSELIAKYCIRKKGKKGNNEQDYSKTDSRVVVAMNVETSTPQDHA